MDRREFLKGVSTAAIAVVVAPSGAYTPTMHVPKMGAGMTLAEYVTPSTVDEHAAKLMRILTERNSILDAIPFSHDLDEGGFYYEPST